MSALLTENGIYEPAAHPSIGACCLTFNEAREILPADTLCWNVYDYISGSKLRNSVSYTHLTLPTNSRV